MSRRVMICDDASFMRTLIEGVLTKAGYDVVAHAEDGSEAVEKYSEVKPDLVTMDLVMPNMGGIEAIRALLTKDPEASVLVCTAVGQDALVEEAMTAGAKGFIVKPFQPQELVATVEQIFEKLEAASAPAGT